MAKKRFGQHFLNDSHVIDHFLQVVNPQSSDHFVEIGPGQGAMTLALLNQHISQLDAIEIEHDAFAIVQQRCKAFETLCLHKADACHFDFNLIQSDQSMRLIGNLPYNIGLNLLFHCLSFRHLFQDIHFMLQKEVVDRIVATPGSKTYGRLSVMVQYYCEAEHLFDVPPSAFWPAPSVMSSVFRLIPYPQLVQNAANDEATLEKIVQQAFSQRRKMIGNSLSHFISTQALEQLGIDPKQRPEQLPKQAFITISNYVWQQAVSLSFF